jgi:hypothetical protein
VDVRDSLLLIDLDKGGEQLGPLFEEPRRRLQEDPAFRRAWGQYQALRALAWEAAPDCDARLIRQGLQASRRQDVERRLARATGSQDVARELLLEPRSLRRSGLPAWAAFLLLLGALGLGWLAFGPRLGTPDADATAPAAAAAAPVAPNGEGPLAFEFPVQTPPADAALDAGTPPSNDETRAEDPAARQARRLVNENLREAAQANEAPSPEAQPSPHPAPTKGQPFVAELATAEPDPSPVPSPTAVAPEPSPLPTAQPSPEPSPVPSAAAGGLSAPQAVDGNASAALLSLSGAQFPADATLALPEASEVDLRLFDMRGRLVRRYAEGQQGAGIWRYKLPAQDEEGRPLPAGSYYLRVICHWFSKVEALEQP